MVFMAQTYANLTLRAFFLMLFYRIWGLLYLLFLVGPLLVSLLFSPSSLLVSVVCYIALSFPCH